ncbi:hypothetical protein [Haliangium ochraceum]|uniref:hypothetical protein n=1 Tax=Haliangium ochraceum TaxID=80816 RepID=UPI00019BAA22|nr:hypothetical protein [Haliangium ochraceum]
MAAEIDAEHTAGVVHVDGGLVRQQPRPRAPAEFAHARQRLPRRFEVGEKTPLRHRPQEIARR